MCILFLGKTIPDFMIICNDTKSFNDSQPIPHTGCHSVKSWRFFISFWSLIFLWFLNRWIEATVFINKSLCKLRVDKKFFYSRFFISRNIFFQLLKFHLIWLTVRVKTLQSNILAEKKLVPWLHLKWNVVAELSGAWYGEPQKTFLETCPNFLPIQLNLFSSPQFYF